MLGKIIENFKVIRWSPYQSIVTDRIAEIRLDTEFDYDTHELYKLWEYFQQLAIKEFNYRDDNKTVIHLESSQNQCKLYIGKKDGTIAIGLAYRRY
jgi:hypothetical protein